MVHTRSGLRVLAPRPGAAVLGVTAWLAVTGMATAAAPSSLPPLSAIEGRYVVLAERNGETIGWARAVLSMDLPCPSVVGVDGVAVAMTPRSNPHQFPVAVCEAELPPGGAELVVADGSLRLPVMPENPGRVLVLGDTGCEAPHGDRPGCDPGQPAQPLAGLAAAAAAERWDLILHLGDLDYRGTSGGKRRFTVTGPDGPHQEEHWTYDAGDGSEAGESCGQSPGTAFWSQNAPNADDPDRWEAWRDDVFVPLADLLPAAPWVFVRGNHELCSRAGPGWFYFFDPSSGLQGGEQRACPRSIDSQDPLDHVVFGSPYELTLGDLSLVVLDTANACDYFTESRVVDRYREQLASIAGRSASVRTRWLLTHRPPWAVTRSEAGRTTPCAPGSQHACVGATLRKALEGVGGDRFPGDPDIVFSAHLHQFQALSGRSPKRPPTLVVGTGGVTASDVTPVGRLTVAVAGEPAEVLALGSSVRVEGRPTSTHAFLEIQRDGSGPWTGRLVDRARGVELVLCDLAGPGAERVDLCRLAPGVEVETPAESH